MNPIISAMGAQVQQPQQNPALDQARQMYRAYRSAADPNEFLRQAVNNNPILAQIIGGGDLKDTFARMCAQRGVDPQSIIDGIQR